MIKIVYGDEIKQFINEYEFSFFSMKRSGYHAIYLWILHHFDDNIFLFDNSPQYNILEKNVKQKFNIFIKNSKLEYTPIFKLENISNINKKCIVYTYEDCFENCNNLFLSPQFYQSEFYIKKDLIIGKSLYNFEIVVLRDPFNLFASSWKSILKKIRGKKGICFYKPKDNKEVYKTIDVWKTYAKEFLGGTLYLKNKICISYNEWFKDIEYRKSISKKLNLEFNDRGLNYVSNYGRGSSFDGRKYDGKAQQMDILNRWKFFKDDEIYRKFFEDEEIWELSEKIFGKIEGTEILRK